MTTIRAVVFTANNSKQEKELPDYATVGALNDSTYWTRPHTPDTFNSQIKRNKEVATSLEVRWFALRPFLARGPKRVRARSPRKPQRLTKLRRQKRKLSQKLQSSLTLPQKLFQLPRGSLSKQKQLTPKELC